MRLPHALLPLAFAAGLALPVVAMSQTTEEPGQTTTTSTTNSVAEQQKFFRDAILEDKRTTSAVRKLVESGAGFVDPATQFADLTGDGKADAVVRVDTGGAAGSIAVYVFSTDGASSSQLRVVYRNQQLYRVKTRIENGALGITVPRYARGDEPCCPSKQVIRTYAWDAKARTMRRTSSTEIPGPGAPAPQR